MKVGEVPRRLAFDADRVLSFSSHCGNWWVARSSAGSQIWLPSPDLVPHLCLILQKPTWTVCSLLASASAFPVPYLMRSPHGKKNEDARNPERLSLSKLSSGLLMQHPCQDRIAALTVAEGSSALQKDRNRFALMAEFKHVTACCHGVPSSGILRGMLISQASPGGIASIWFTNVICLCTDITSA